MMKYGGSEEYKGKCIELCKRLEFKHVDPERVSVIVSKGSKARRTIARIHTLSKALQLGMAAKPFYVIELISERFFKLSEAEQTKVLIHELMHIPHSFGGGFRMHKPYVNSRTVEKEYERLISQTRIES